MTYSWRRMRRAGHEAIHKSRATDYFTTQSKEAVIMTDLLLKSSQDLAGEFRRWGYFNWSGAFINASCSAGASAMLSILYDIPPTLSAEDPTIKTISDFTHTAIHYTRPGHYLVEIFTWMKYLPSSIAKWKRKAEKESNEYSRFFETMFNQVRDRVVTFSISSYL